MTGRERISRAMHYQPVDKAPVEFYYAPVGYYEHGEKLNDLYSRLPGDFEPFVRMPIVGPAPHEYDENGAYHAYRRDEWGVLWEYRIFGIAGMPCEYPLGDIENLKTFAFPPKAKLKGPEFEAFCQKVKAHQQEHYHVVKAGSLFERLIELRPDEDVLCDIALDEPYINELADKILEYDKSFVDLAIAAGSDGVAFGDDYGTERSLIMSPATWRRFIKPRLRELFLPAVRAGKTVHFHTCGQVSEILEDLREVGVTSIWPQLPAYDMKTLADRCRELGLAVSIHTDRANTMTYGTPEMVRELVKREFDTFRMMDGGSWFYIEADNGFPFQNLEALVETILQLR